MLTLTESVPKVLNVVQINLHHCRAAALNLQAVILSDKVDVALIQEPWQVKGQVMGLDIPGFKVLTPFSNSKVRTCIVLKDDLVFTYLSCFSNPDLTVTIIEECEEGNGLLLAAAYLPYDSPDLPPGDDVAKLVQHCTDNRLDLVIGADANAHNICWGSTDTNTRGESLLEFIASNNLVISNVGNKPTFENRLRREVLDITLISASLCGSVNDWHVSDALSLSDHKLIFFNIDTKREFRTLLPSTYRNIRHTNWTKYESLVARHCNVVPQLDSHDDIDRAVLDFQNNLTEAWESSCPLRQRNSKRGPIWWNNNLSNLRKLANRSINRAKRSGHPLDWTAARTVRLAYKSELRNSKRDHWKEQCSNVTSSRDAARMVRAFSGNPDIQLGSLKRLDGTSTQSTAETLSLLLQTHFPGCEIGGSVADFRSATSQPPHIGDCDFITPGRVRWAVDSFSPFKSAGLDNIRPVLLQKMGDSALSRLKDIFVACLRHSFIPSAWRASKVVFLPKPGKDTYDLPKSFRPICLMSFLLKTLERLCDRHIRDLTLTRSPLHRLQHAYMAGRSVESALHCVVGKIESARSRKEYALGLFLDIEGAFDKVKVEVVLRAFAEFGMDTMVSQWIINMLRNRSVKTDLKGSVISAIVHQGCPQGGVLSPLIWSMVVDSLLLTLNNLGYYSVGYADDIVIIPIGKHLSTVTEVAQQALCVCERWCVSSGLSVNPAKTGVVLFSNVRNYSLPSRLTLFGKCLDLVEDTKYLGVILDRKLNFGKHVTQKCQKAIRTLFQCRRAFGHNWGLSPKITSWIYTAMVRPALCYASLVWWPRVRVASMTVPLKKIQRLACICISGAIRTTALTALEVLLSITPIDVHIESEALLSALRLRDTGNWSSAPGRTGHSEIFNKSSLMSSDLCIRSDNFSTTRTFEQPFKCIIPSKDAWVYGSVPVSGIKIYTDGSSTKMASGAGVFSNDLSIRSCIPLGEKTTAFQAEIFAILEAASISNDLGLRDQNINILTDSQAALQALSSINCSSLLVRECCTRLEQLAACNNVILFWIPAHVDLEGNREADSLATEASRLRLIGPQPQFGISSKSRRSIVLRNVHDAHTSLWNNTSEGVHTKLFVPKPSYSITRAMLDYSRSKLGLFFNYITGHSLNKHLFRLRITPSPLCRLCLEEDECTSHILCDCPAIVSDRLSVFGCEFIAPTQIQTLQLKKMFNFVDSILRNN